MTMDDQQHVQHIAKRLNINTPNNLISERPGPANTKMKYISHQVRSLRNKRGTFL
jgi:recombination DNA repair RAD52 pathway protein